jgi:hypothetical protein
MDAQLEAADIVLSLVKADFFLSRYCRETKMPHALVQHTTGET